MTIINLYELNTRKIVQPRDEHEGEHCTILEKVYNNWNETIRFTAITYMGSSFISSNDVAFSERIGAALRCIQVIHTSSVRRSGS